MRFSIFTNDHCCLVLNVFDFCGKVQWKKVFLSELAYDCVRRDRKMDQKDCYSNNLQHLLSVQSVVETVRQGSGCAASLEPTGAVVIFNIEGPTSVVGVVVVVVVVVVDICGSSSSSSSSRYMW